MVRIIIHKQENKTEIKDLFNEKSFTPTQIPAHNDENIIIIPYSLKKIKTNPTEAYSILNPETSSLSPSAKSNGVRLVSATHIITHRTHINGIVYIQGELFTENCRDREVICVINTIKIIASLTSYEIVWATARMPPIILYFLLDDHPLSKTGYTPTLKIIKNSNMEAAILATLDSL